MDRRFIVLVLCVLCCGPAGCSLFSGGTIVDQSAGQGHGAAATTLAMTLAVSGGSAPVPDDDKSDVCPNCDGTGKVGDGRVFVTCQACGGTGKKKRNDGPEITAIAPAMVEGACKCQDCDERLSAVEKMVSDLQLKVMELQGVVDGLKVNPPMPVPDGPAVPVQPAPEAPKPAVKPKINRIVLECMSDKFGNSRCPYCDQWWNGPEPGQLRGDGFTVEKVAVLPSPNTSYPRWRLCVDDKVVLVVEFTKSFRADLPRHIAAWESQQK